MTEYDHAEMSGEQLDRLKRLLEIWQPVDPETVKLDNWVCGTHACLAGHACMAPGFIAQGLMLMQDGFSGKLIYPKFGDWEGFDAVSEFFGTGEPFALRGECFLDHDIIAECSDEQGFISDWSLANERLKRYIALTESRMGKR
jgi:hypothetical protein